MTPSDAEAKLLLVDDLPENLLALEALLRGDGRQIHRAGSGEEALSLLLQHDFALAILDVQMPGMNGFELAELMRGAEKTKHIPIVFVSAAGRELNYAFKGYETGAVDFLHKPLDVHAVKSKVAVFIDLFRQRKALRHQLEELERARGEQEALLQELQTTQAELQRAVRMRDDFMSMVSHELRTPLNTLFLETQLRKLQAAKGDAAALSPDQLRAMVARDERQLQSMIRLIDDMLDVSRLRTGQLSIRPRRVDLAALARRVIADFARQADAAGCALSLDCDDNVEGVWDEFRLEQVMANLLTNAMRYGAAQPIQVTVRATETGACLAVQDHGIGISPEDQQRIFHQFERATGREAAAGLGLGLFITEQIVRAHGGTIALESAVGAGSRFSVLLPVETPQPLPA